MFTIDSLTRQVTLWACALLCASSALNAQTTGVITGTVTDPSRSNVPGAEVSVRNTDTGETKTGHTNGSGIYAAYALPGGKYTLEVTATGFKKASKSDIQLNVADQLAVNFT